RAAHAVRRRELRVLLRRHHPRQHRIRPRSGREIFRQLEHLRLFPRRIRDLLQRHSRQQIDGFVAGPAVRLLDRRRAALLNARTPLARQQLLARLDGERAHASRGREVKQVLPRVTRWRSGDGSHHAVIFSSLDEDCADVVIDEQIAHYRELASEFEWKLYAHDKPDDLLSRLRRRGFEIGPREAFMVFDLSNRAEWIHDSVDPAVIRVEREDQIADYRRVAEAVFDKDYAFTYGELAEAIRAGSTDHVGYIAYDGREPVS